MLINLSKTNSTVRIIAGTSILSIGTHVLWFMLVPVGVMLIFTGLSSRCLITHLFFKPSQKAIENRYINNIPRANPQPVFVFTKDNSMLFANNAAKQLLPDVVKLTDLTKTDLPLLQNLDSVQTETLTLDNGKVFSLVLKATDSLDGVFVYLSEITEIVELNLEIIETQKEIVYAMGEIGETRSQETGDHVRRVAEYSELLANLYGLDQQEAELIKLASPMHDIGKVGIPDAILKKPGKLTESEFDVMRTHAEIGYNLLRHSARPILQAAAIIAYQHHEKWNGSGYPQGTKGEDIHIYGRITAVVDVFDALGSARIYKEAWPMERILTLFANERGIHFDPQLVDLLTDNLDEFIKIKDKYPG